MRRYETILIAHADLSEDELSALIARYEAIIAARKGIPVKVERWGKRKLAYLIRKQSRGFYVLVDYAGESATVNELERNLKIDDKVLKFMTIQKADQVDPAALDKELAEAAAAAAPQAAAASEAPVAVSAGGASPEAESPASEEHPIDSKEEKES